MVYNGIINKFHRGDFMKKFNPTLYILGFLACILIGVIADITFLVILGFAILATMFIVQSSSNKTNKSTTVEQAKSIFDENEVTNFVVGDDNLTAIGIDETKMEIIHLSRPYLTDSFKQTKIPFPKVLEVKLIEDDQVVTSVNRAGQVGGALVGGMLAGGVGAIIGGLGASQRSDKEVKKINLEIVIDNITSPILNVSFMNEDLPIKNYEPKYKTKYEVANKWYRSFTVILKRNELNQNNV